MSIESYMRRRWLAEQLNPMRDTSKYTYHSLDAVSYTNNLFPMRHKGVSPRSWRVNSNNDVYEPKGNFNVMPYTINDSRTTIDKAHRAFFGKDD